MENEFNESNEKIIEIKPFVFSEKEVSEIRQSLAGEKTVSSSLQEKIQNDPLVAECSVAMFFPVISERISQNNERPKVEAIQAGARGRVLKASFEDMAYIIKPLENSQESAIAKSMAEIGVGPEQYESINGYITEKFIEGDAINRVNSDKCTPEFMEMIGQKMGDTVKRIHEKGILINDQLFSDDSGKSHTIIGPEGDVHLIDFGASINLANFPEISDENVYLIIRSDTFASFSLGMISDQDLPSFMGKYRQDVLSQFKTKEEVIDRYDGQLIHEGFSFLSQRIQNVGSLADAFNKANS